MCGTPREDDGIWSRARGRSWKELSRNALGVRDQSDSIAEPCRKCGQSVREDCLPEAGHCGRMIVKYKCPECRKSWTTQRGRFSIREKRTLGNDCEKCKCPGDVLESKVLSREALENLGKQREASCGPAKARR